MGVFNTSGNSDSGVEFSAPSRKKLKLLVFICLSLIFFAAFNSSMLVHATVLGGAFSDGELSDLRDTSDVPEEDSLVYSEDVPETEDIPDVSSGDIVVHNLSDTPQLTYDDFSEFEALPLTVNRYEYEIFKKIEFIQYALAIEIALLFLLFFKRK